MADERKTPEPQERPLCAVRGLIRPGAMCGSVIVGGKLCGFDGACPHKVAAQIQNMPAGAGGERDHA